MSDKPLDPTLKSLVEIGPDDWTVLAGEPAAPTRIIDADIATVSGAANKVLRVEAKPPYLLHLEFVAGHDAANLPSALNKRNVLLDDRHGLLVRTVVVLLKPAADSPALSGLRQRGFPDEVPYNVFGYRVIRVWQIPPDQLLAGGLGTLPLAPITRRDKRAIAWHNKADGIAIAPPRCGPIEKPVMGLDLHPARVTVFASLGETVVARS